MLSAKENYVSHKPKLLASVGAGEATRPFIQFDRNRQYYGRPAAATVQTDDYYDLVADPSADRRTWKTRVLEDGRPQAALLDSRLYFENKTPSRQSRLLIESQDNLTSSTDQKQSHMLSQVSYETHHRHERAAANAKNMNNYCKWSKQYQVECQERKDRALMFKSFLDEKSATKCKYCQAKRQPVEQLIQKNLLNSVRQKYSIGDENYLFKCVNDILFNKRLDDDDAASNSRRGERSKRDIVQRLKERLSDKSLRLMNIQKLSGQFLLAAFKDYLIYDEIYDFVECFTPTHESRQEIIYYIQTQRQKAVVKYGFKRCPRGLCAWQFHGRRNENIVNRPSMALQNKRLQAVLGNNLKMKYLMRYEKRAAEQKLRVKAKEREAQAQKQMLYGGRPVPMDDSRAYDTFIDHE